MGINVGISEKDRKSIARGLSRILADTYTLYLKTHNFHWNVRGPHFRTLHDQFEEQYTELAAAIDQIAERIRTLGMIAPGSYAKFSELTEIPEGTGEESAEDMIRALADDNETVARVARQVVLDVDRASDEASADLLAQRMQVHEKNAWMLRTLLEGEQSRPETRRSERASSPVVETAPH